MTATVTPDSTLVHRANLNIAAAVMAKSGPRVPDSLIGRAIDEIRASHPVAELAESGNMPMVVSAVETFLARHHEADRPRNLYGAEAARAAQAAGGADHSRGGAGFGTIDAIRAGSSARYRDLGSDGARTDSGSGSSRGSSATSGTGSEPAGAPFWGTAKGMMLTRSYANDNNMGWVPPDLMQMGRPALQALKETGLKGDGFRELRDPNGLHFDNPTIVAGARYMKAVGGNYDKAAKAMSRVDKFEQPPALRREGRQADHDLMHSNEQNRLQRQQRVIEVDKKRIEANKDIAPAVQEKWRQLHIDHLAGMKAEATAKNDGDQAKKDAAAAKQKGAAVQATGQQAAANQQATRSSKGKLGAALDGP